MLEPRRCSLVDLDRAEFLDGPCPSEAEYARDTLRAALQDAAVLRLPVIVDG
jgi:hypothetical protein